MSSTILAAHVASTWFMTGLIWFVQIVHYPLMSRVGAAGFARYAEEHARRTSWVVGPPMLVEAITAWLLVLHPAPGVGRAGAWAGLALVGIIWASTLALQVPAHRKLSEEFDAPAFVRLVSSNWIRTAAWSVRGLLVLGWLR